MDDFYLTNFLQWQRLAINAVARHHGRSLAGEIYWIPPLVRDRENQEEKSNGKFNTHS